MGSIYFISPVAYGMNPVFTVVGTFIFRIQYLGQGRSVVLMDSSLLTVTTLKKGLMMGYVLDELPAFVRKVMRVLHYP